MNIDDAVIQIATQNRLFKTYQEGMTLRDWFAGMAISAIYTRSDGSSADGSKWAYELADAMIAERAKAGS